jgi:hypothetical protein
MCNNWIEVEIDGGVQIAECTVIFANTPKDQKRIDGGSDKYSQTNPHKVDDHRKST